ncbi:MAG: hydroxyacid dehydrogenase [Deltaproteobacteria bacterium]|nr:hydroxyacid dehydrogenase [Deltaproteobacteria bacterium]
MSTQKESITKVLITDGLAKEGLELFKHYSQFDIDLRKSIASHDLAKIIPLYDCVVIRSATTLTRELIELGTSLKLIVRAGAGVDNIDVKVATERKIPVMNTATANSLAAAEQAISLLFAMFRMIPQSMISLRENKWDRESFKGHEVTGKILGVLGLGNIGKIVAEKALGLGMKVIGYDPAVKSLSQLPLQISKNDENFKLAQTLDEALNHSHVITIHIPKTKGYLICSDQISKMKDKAFLINCSRGGIVDEKAVIAALDQGKLSGAAFDVYEKEPPQFPNPLFQHSKIICTPHLGASTFEAQERVAQVAAEQMIKFFVKGERAGIIN